MLSLELALALRAVGLGWEPRPGDRFAVVDRELDDQVFVISDMVISSVDVPHGPPILAFNGTTEWALDSLEVDQACWLPREDQLRGHLGEAFASLERLDGSAVGYAVVLTDGSRHVDLTADAAYARAVLARLSPLG